MAAHLLEVKNLKTSFDTDNGAFNAVDGVSFHVDQGRTLGIVGESGCGKSVTSLSILRLIQSPGKIESGEILFSGRDLIPVSESEMRKLRGNEIAMIFQDPMSSLNPVFTCGQQIEEVLRLHVKNLSSSEYKAKATEMLSKVGLTSPENIYDEYPHRLSGGMCQRVMIAMAMSCSPQLLIADEPTTALDVTIQAQILSLIKSLQKESKTAMILITHDLGVIAQTCDDVAVMYAGRIVEQGTVQDIFYRPQHPYTQGLLASIPVFNSATSVSPRLLAIPGAVPDPLKLPSGCRFRDRCARAQGICQKTEPHLEQIAGENSFHQAACYFPGRGKVL
jgi:oligopeptide/dipeptide ABC transporter ATP-binding protein